MDSVTACTCGRQLYRYTSEFLRLKKEGKDIGIFFKKENFNICCSMNMTALLRIDEQIKKS
jgi:hypothetical protein